MQDWEVDFFSRHRGNYFEDGQKKYKIMAAPSSKHTCSATTEEKEDPGAAPYGNFINYYTFNPPDNRLSLIPRTLLEDVGYEPDTEAVLVLDVGCNSGVRKQT